MTSAHLWPYGVVSAGRCQDGRRYSGNASRRSPSTRRTEGGQRARMLAKAETRGVRFRLNNRQRGVQLWWCNVHHLLTFIGFRGNLL